MRFSKNEATFLKEAIRAGGVFSSLIHPIDFGYRAICQVSEEYPYGCIKVEGEESVNVDQNIKLPYSGNRAWEGAAVSLIFLSMLAAQLILEIL